MPFFGDENVYVYLPSAKTYEFGDVPNHFMYTADFWDKSRVNTLRVFISFVMLT